MQWIEKSTQVPDKIRGSVYSKWYMFSSLCKNTSKEANLANVMIKPAPKSISKTTVLSGVKHRLREYSTELRGSYFNYIASIAFVESTYKSGLLFAFFGKVIIKASRSPSWSHCLLTHLVCPTV